MFKVNLVLKFFLTPLITRYFLKFFASFLCHLCLDYGSQQLANLVSVQKHVHAFDKEIKSKHCGWFSELFSVQCWQLAVTSMILVTAAPCCTLRFAHIVQ